MEILNKKERYSAFVMFLLMFGITTGILIFALYFNFKLPLKENEVLRNENELMNKQFDYQKNFSKEFGNVVKMLDSLKKNFSDNQIVCSSIHFHFLGLHSL